MDFDKIKYIIKIALPGFEPGSQAPKACILDRCTIGLYKNNQEIIYKTNYSWHIFKLFSIARFKRQNNNLISCLKK